MRIEHEESKKFFGFALLALVLFSVVVLIMWKAFYNPVPSEMKAKASTIVSILNAGERQTLVKELGHEAPADTLLKDVSCTTAQLGDIEVKNDTLFTFTIRCPDVFDETVVYMSRNNDGTWWANVP